MELSKEEKRRLRAIEVAKKFNATLTSDNRFFVLSSDTPRISRVKNLVKSVEGKTLLDKLEKIVDFYFDHH